MEIGPLSRMPIGLPVVAETAPENQELTRELIIAIRGLNQTEFLAEGRELKLRRAGAGKRPTVDVRDRETGDVIDELPPEEILRMMAELKNQQEEET